MHGGGFVGRYSGTRKGEILSSKGVVPITKKEWQIRKDTARRWYLDELIAWLKQTNETAKAFDLRMAKIAGRCKRQMERWRKRETNYLINVRKLQI